MSREQREARTSGTADSQVLRFVSRAEQLGLRGQRNYSRWMLVTKGFVDPHGLERTQWQKEFVQDSQRDAEWNQRHGPIPGGARILQWRHEHETAVQVADESRPGGVRR
jgi:hypothetical protein